MQGTAGIGHDHVAFAEPFADFSSGQRLSLGRIPLEIAVKYLATGTATPLAAVTDITKGLITDIDILVRVANRNATIAARALRGIRWHNSAHRNHI